jgi:hypothetical protein
MHGNDFVWLAAEREGVPRGWRCRWGDISSNIEAEDASCTIRQELNDRAES